MYGSIKTDENGRIQILRYRNGSDIAPLLFFSISAHADNLPVFEAWDWNKPAARGHTEWPHYPWPDVLNERSEGWKPLANDTCPAIIELIPRLERISESLNNFGDERTNEEQSLYPIVERLHDRVVQRSRRFRLTKPKVTRDTFGLYKWHTEEFFAGPLEAPIGSITFRGKSVYTKSGVAQAFTSWGRKQFWHEGEEKRLSSLLPIVQRARQQQSSVGFVKVSLRKGEYPSEPWYTTLHVPKHDAKPMDYRQDQELCFNSDHYALITSNLDALDNVIQRLHLCHYRSAEFIPRNPRNGNEKPSHWALAPQDLYSDPWNLIFLDGTEHKTRL